MGNGDSLRDEKILCPELVEGTQDRAERDPRAGFFEEGRGRGKGTAALIADAAPTLLSAGSLQLTAPSSL